VTAAVAPTVVRTVAVVLAAGSGSRFAGPGHKLDALLGGRTLLAIAVDAAVRADIGEVVVVTGAHRPALPAGVAELHNDRWAEGQITSVRLAVAHADAIGADAVVIGLADQPFVTAEAWRAVAASRSPIAVATYDGRRGNPVRLHRSVWPLLPTSGDEGARALMRLRPDLVEPVPCRGSAADIDTWEDLRTWQSSSSTSSP
jgi:CTP:molybdopterin cytidylyltransferase MocA